jgi:hypothetical protein
VRLDVDGDGFDDGTTTADASGHFRFVNVPLASGVNAIRAAAVNAFGTTTVARNLTRDADSPSGTLAGPLVGAVTNTDLGFVAIQWRDVGGAGLDESTFGVDDISIAGVTVNRIDNLGGGLVLYHYGDTGTRLTRRHIEVQFVAGAVVDLAGNRSAARTESFTLAASDSTPTAAPDLYSLQTDRALSVAGSNGVLANDTDADGDPLTAVLMAGPSHGTLVLGRDGSFRYIPNAHFAGIDHFAYRATQGDLDSDAVTVTLVIGAELTPTSSAAGASNPLTSTASATSVLTSDLLSEALTRTSVLLTTATEPPAFTEPRADFARGESAASFTALARSSAAFDSSGGEEESDVFWPWLDRQPLPGGGDTVSLEGEAQDDFWLWLGQDQAEESMWLPASDGFEQPSPAPARLAVAAISSDHACENDAGTLPSTESSRLEQWELEPPTTSSLAGPPSILAQFMTSLFGWCGLLRQRRRKRQEADS